jgi:2,4-dichlorophenol 6-monooxygenase
MEFNEHNVEYGYSYASAAIVPDASPPRHNPDPIRVYQPSTRPGSPVPHAWVEDRDGARRAIRDLVAPGRFLLIAGEDGHAWLEAAHAVADQTRDGVLRGTSGSDKPRDSISISRCDRRGREDA